MGLKIPWKENRSYFNHLFVLYFLLLISTKCISSLPPICSVIRGQIITTLAFNSVFHFQVDFVWNVSSEICPSPSGFYWLLADSTNSSISLTSFFCFKLCLLLEDLFSISHLAILCVEWSLCSLRIFFSSQSVHICWDTSSETCLYGTCPDSYTDFPFV